MSELFGNPEQLPHTPTTEEVSIGWAWYKAGWIHSDEIQPQFDRWIAEIEAHSASRAAIAERRRIIKLLEAKLMGKATNVETGKIDWSSFEGDILALIKGEQE